MQLKLENLQKTYARKVDEAKNINELRDLEISIFGRKGELTAILRGLANLSPEEKPKAGKMANEVKKSLQATIEKKKIEFKSAKINSIAEEEWLDVTVPGKKKTLGRIHPISRFIQEIEDVFGRMGFDVVDSQEVEKEYYNFTALNIPDDHPAREAQDTFFIKNMEKYVLRTQTSSTQIRYMEGKKPPFRIIAPGKTFRKDNDATHSPMFHQFEGLMVDENISIAHLRAVLIEALKELLGATKLNIRFRTSYFPFVEPGLEVDVSCVICEGSGRLEGRACKVCKESGWLEMGGAGAVHPRVLKNVGIDPEKYTGFAFGFGVERPLMIRHKIDDLRLFLNNDVRFLEQF